ncbi:hypothetical protein MTP04_22530 [Lysinibacillus sp. PLM2]|nr:hypothetical protein MTP04_22530 [Lysinibacillus sp. PLM2]
MMTYDFAYECINNPKHVFAGNNLDGVRCPYCDGLVNIIQVPTNLIKNLPRYRELKKEFEKLKPNEIEIIMSDVNKPPKIKLNGKDIEGIVTLEYMYVTKDCELEGVHNFMVQYLDKETKTIRTVSANKFVEG